MGPFADYTLRVVGAGALGNEVIKNLALMGIGNILIISAGTSVRESVGAEGDAWDLVTPEGSIAHWHARNLARRALAQAPRPGPDVDGLPFAGGLVGVSGYDVVRLFERLPRNTAPQTNVPDAAFSAPTSFLVFDHLTRRVALLHDGPDAERQALRREVIERLRGPVPAARTKVEISPATASLSETEFTDRVDACKEYIAAGDIYQIVMSVRFSGRHTLSPFEAYRAMPRSLMPSGLAELMSVSEMRDLVAYLATQKMIEQQVDCTKGGHVV